MNEFWSTIDSKMQASAEAYYARERSRPRQHDEHVKVWRAHDWARLLWQCDAYEAMNKSEARIIRAIARRIKETT
jgi:hypothetical protein